jgi:stage II sporulation protein R
MLITIHCSLGGFFMFNESLEFFKKKPVILWGALLIALLGIGYLGMSKSKSISEDMLRLHVIANSDLPEDQAIKLEVRDVVLQFMEQNFSQIDNKKTMMDRVNKDLGKIKAEIQEYLGSKKLDFEIQVELVNMTFPSVEYGLLTVPTGEYDAVRVIIGNGTGKNWWCVLFPPLCLGNERTVSFTHETVHKKGASLNQEENLSELNFLENEIEALQVKFKILEIFQGNKRKISVFS